MINVKSEQPPKDLSQDLVIITCFTTISLKVGWRSVPEIGEQEAGDYDTWAWQKYWEILPVQKEVLEQEKSKAIEDYANGHPETGFATQVIEANVAEIAEFNRRAISIITTSGKPWPGDYRIKLKFLVEKEVN